MKCADCERLAHTCATCRTGILASQLAESRALCKRLAGALKDIETDSDCPWSVHEARSLLALPEVAALLTEPKK